MRLPTLRLALALVLLAAALLPGLPGRALAGSPEQAPKPRGLTGPKEIAIPSIKLVAEVTPVEYQLSDQTITWQTAEKAVGWHRSSAMPGSPGNAVMSGHNATRGSGVFRNLHKVKLGDRITVTVNGKNLDYVVTDRVIFPQLFASEYRRARNAAWLGHFGDERLTLITCYPWYSNTHRLVVVAHPIDSSNETSKARNTCADGRSGCPQGGS